jgi:hypothetical protein
VTPADVPANRDFNGLICPTGTKARSEAQKQFGGLSNPQARDEPYDAAADFSRSIDACYAAIRERVAAGGKGWEPPR